MAPRRRTRLTDLTQTGLEGVGCRFPGKTGFWTFGLASQAMGP